MNLSKNSKITLEFIKKFLCGEEFQFKFQNDNENLEFSALAFNNLKLYSELEKSFNKIGKNYAQELKEFIFSPFGKILIHWSQIFSILSK